MNKKLKNLLILLVVSALFLANQAGLLGDSSGRAEPAKETVGIVQSNAEAAPPTVHLEEIAPPSESGNQADISEDGEYTSCEEVALYIHQFGHLPGNYITKEKAKDLGWVSSAGNLWKVAPGKSIGGDYFGNYEGSLPKKKGRKYYECDIDFDGKYRNAKRILFSNDGLIYYTDDHYETFTLLYGEG